MNATLKRNIDPGFSRTILGPGNPMPSKPVKDPGFSKSPLDIFAQQPDFTPVPGKDKNLVDRGFGPDWLDLSCDGKPPMKGGVEVDPGFTRSLCDSFVPSDDALELLGGEKSKVRTIFDSLGF